MDCIYCMKPGAREVCCHCGATYCLECSTLIYVNGKWEHEELLECIHVMSMRIKAIERQELGIYSSQIGNPFDQDRQKKTLE